MGENNNSSSGSGTEGTGMVKSELRPVVSPVLQSMHTCNPTAIATDHLISPAGGILSSSSPPVLQSSSSSAIAAGASFAAVATATAPHLSPYTSQVQNGLQAQQSGPQNQSHLHHQYQQQLNQQQQQQSQQQQSPYASANNHHSVPHHNPSPPVMYTSADYLAQLLKDQKQVSAFPGVFFHLDRLLNEGKGQLQSGNHADSRRSDLFWSVRHDLLLLFRRTDCHSFFCRLVHVFVYESLFLPPPSLPVCVFVESPFAPTGRSHVCAQSDRLPGA